MRVLSPNRSLCLIKIRGCLGDNVANSRGALAVIPIATPALSLSNWCCLHVCIISINMQVHMKRAFWHLTFRPLANHSDNLL